MHDKTNNSQIEEKIQELIDVMGKTRRLMFENNFSWGQRVESAVETAMEHAARMREEFERNFKEGFEHGNHHGHGRHNHPFNQGEFRHQGEYIKEKIKQKLAEFKHAAAAERAKAEEARDELGIPKELSGMRNTMLQFRGLKEVSENPGMTVGELSEKLHMSSAAVAQFLNRLVSALLLERLSDEDDRRINRLYLTEKGRRVLDKLQVGYFAKMKDMVSPLSEAELDQFISLHKKILRHLEQQKNTAVAQSDSEVKQAESLDGSVNA